MSFLPVDIQYVRLEEDVSETINRIARSQARRVSDVVNQILRQHFERTPPEADHDKAGSSRAEYTGI